ncbi:flagellar biosynthetic protein FlhB [Asticcacaulis biprosthecium C19]|uniref:Flagellar biosynthetic protein FlhB n=1 Tax=Asticcacaulis biprosthecium C19 TaxID=715226 RepID=F4QPA5_9CAUL|nr:flagellar biosynthesis protein FlhB [Asticcacaulis biprosthecium]EGF91163.1 flagellar biosynthetic protein FlhB [Asticcacaulis biprosthecium C19]
MAEEPDSEDKTEEASAKKLSQAREKGDVAKSADLPQALSLIGACAVIALYGPSLSSDLVDDLIPFLAHPQQLLGSLEGDGGVTIMREMVFAFLPIVIIVMGVTLLLGIGGHVMQTGLMFTTEKLKPSLTKLNPMSGFKRLFGFDALIQFAKTVVKLIITGAIVWQVLKGKLYEIMALAKASPLLILPYAMDVFVALAIAVCIFLFIEGAADYMWQRFRFMQRMKMSKQEQKEEYKQMEGDPHIKAKLRQIRMEKSRRRMMSNVKDATVVITNPTHYAVALQFEMGQMQAPLCVAKGVDTLALKIREEAGKHNVPIVEDVPLARALYAAIDVDETIPEEHFAAVAQVISFVLAKKRRGF